MDNIYRDERIRKEFSKKGVIKALIFTAILVGDIAYKMSVSREKRFAYILIGIMLLSIIFTIHTFRKNGVTFSDIISIRKSKNKKIIYKINNSAMAMVIFGTIFLLFYCVYAGFMFTIKAALFELIIFAVVIVYIFIEERIICRDFNTLSLKEVNSDASAEDSKSKMVK